MGGTLDQLPHAHGGRTTSSLRHRHAVWSGSSRPRRAELRRVERGSSINCRLGGQSPATEPFERPGRLVNAGARR